MRRDRQHRSLPFVVTILAFAGSVAPASGGAASALQDGNPASRSVGFSDGARILDEDLREIVANPIRIDETKVIGWDQPGGIPDPIPLLSALAVVVGPSTDREVTPVWRYVRERAGDDAAMVAPYVRFTDGQIVPGNLTADGETPLWRSAWLHPLPLDLERIREVRLVEGATVPVATEADEVVLVNGDRIRGLVDSIGTHLVLEQEDDPDGEPLRIPLDRVASFALVNPEDPPQGTIVWFLGGHRIICKGIAVTGNSYVRLDAPTLGGESIEVPYEFLRGVVFDARRITPLAALPITVGPGLAAPIRSWIPEPVIEPGNWAWNAAPIRLMGPLRANWRLPVAGCRIATTLELPLDSDLGRLEVVVRDGDREVRRIPLDAERPVHRLVVELDTDRFGLEIEMGEDGPFHDVVTLREAIVVRPVD
jgi:hypothetical protein